MSSGDDFEWDASAAPPPTAWSTTATASRPARGRRAVYGSRSNRGGPSKLYGRNRSGSGGNANNSKSSSAALVREESIGPLDEHDEVGGGFAENGTAISIANTRHRYPSDENIGGGSGARSRSGGSGLLMQRETSMNSTGTLDSSISSAAAAANAFEHGTTSSTGPTRFPPRPSGGSGTNGTHSRSNSASGLPGRPPASASSSASSHQRSTSLMSPLGGGIVGSGSILFGNVSRSSTSLAALDGIDRENYHPNHPPSSSNPSSQNNTPQKVFGTSLSAPNSAAPSPAQPGFDDEISSISSRNNANRRTKKTRTASDGDAAVAAAFGGRGGAGSSAAAVPTPRPMSVPMSSPMSSTSVTSSTSFSSLSKMGDMAPTWVKRSLQGCIGGSGTAARRPSLDVNPSNSASLGPSPGLSSSSSSSSSAHGYANNPNATLSSPTRSIAAGSTASSRKRGVCDSPLLEGDDIVYSPGGSAGMMSCSSRRSRARSRIFSPDSTKKLMARAARGTGCGIVDDDFFRSSSVGADGSSTSRHGRHSSLSLSQQSFEGDGNGAASSAPTEESHHHHRHRRADHQKRDGLFHPEDTDDDTDDDDDDDQSNLSMVDASMETEGSEPAGIAMSSRINAHRKNGSGDDPTARLFGASGDGDASSGRRTAPGPPQGGLSQMSPPPRADRRSRSDTFAESVFGSVDGDSFAMATSPEKKGGACTMDESPAPSPDDKTTAGDADSGGAAAAATANAEEVENPLEDVSSYEDLKYLIKILRKWSNGKNAASFGAGTGCTIAIPAKWSQARRQSFLSWSIKGLGFNIDSVQQGKARSIKAPARKATKIHQDIEAKLLRHKELTGHSAGAPVRTTGAAASKSKAADSEPHPLFASASQMVASSRSTSGSGVPRSVAFPQRSKDVDMDLLSNMDSLALDESVSSARPSKVAHRAATSAAAAPASNDAATGTSTSNNHGTPLVRVVTLDPRQQDGVSSSLPCFAPMSVESKGAATPSFELARPRAPRHSGEYNSEDCAAGSHIMQHINGFSSEEEDDDMGGGAERNAGGGRSIGRRFGARPPRMSTGSTSTRPRSLGGGGGRSLMPPVEETTPAPPSQIKMMSLVKSTPTYDITTPMPDGPGFWGSRPIPGKDWGTSEKCDDAIIAVLLKRHEKTFAESDYCDPNSPVAMITSQTPLTESTAKKNVAPLIPFMNQPISASAVNSAALGFDLEADKKKSPIQLLRPKSRLNLDGAESDSDEDDDDEALEMNGGDDFDADMGMGSMLDRRQSTFDASQRRMTGASGRSSRGVYGSRSNSNRGGLVRHGSVGATALSALVLNEELGPSPDKLEKRRKMSLAVRRRMSLCAVAFDMKQSRRYTSSFAVAPSPTKFGKGRSSSRRQTAFMAGTNVIPEASPSADDSLVEEAAMDIVLRDEELLSPIFSYLTEQELLISASVVQMSWAEAATSAHATLMLVSVGCSTSFVEGGNDEDDDSDDDDDDDNATNDGSGSMIEMVTTTGGDHSSNDSIAKSMERSWHFLNDKFPWATFLSEGAFKRVYRVWNSTVNAEEAVSVMDVDTIEDMGNKEIVGAELSVSVLLSSLVRRNVCPNFVVTRGVFTCPYEPASSHWGCAENKKPKGSSYDPNRALREGLPVIPSDEERGKFQYIRMELCRHGDMEEWLKTQPGQSISANEARMLFFQMSFALHAAADRYSMKHYDVKLLNFFLQSADDANANGNGDATDGTRHPDTVLRYGIGSSVFGLRMSTSRALIAKLADYGTANIRPESNGQPVTIGQFTTLENSPPEFMISGDAAKQGYGHDSFGLGLCMLHLFTGDAPYEEILENATCPVALKRKLKNIWENQSSNGYDVIRCVILADVYEDEDGNVEGEPDEVLYDTLYRYLVLFGIPDNKSQYKEGARVWRAITSCLIGQAPKSTAAAPVPARRSTRRNAARATAATSDVPVTLAGPDAAQYEIDTSLFSLRTGTDPRIAEARQKLEAMDGGMELLLSLVSFDPSTRATPLDAINSNFFAPLREEDGMDMYGPSDQIKSFMAMGYAS